jgi:RNA polymerase sigma factor (sigma-70 family)
MGPSQDEFSVLMERVLTGDEAAAVELLQRYGGAVRLAVRRRLHRRLRTKFDSIDFMQDVWASFFANPPRPEAFEGSDKLIAFLTTVARNKVIDATRQRLVSQQYNITNERSLDRSTPGGPNQVPGLGPTPSQVVTGDDQWSKLMATQPPAYRRILILLRDGKKPTEIAEETGIHRRTVCRVIDKLLSRLTS